jgi:hypothetical protein
MLRVLSAAILMLIVTVPPCANGQLSFNRDVRPILSEHCWQCHGFDEGARKAGLRLDVRDQALAAAASGNVAVVPGHPEKSELVRRITADDADLRMPPADFPKPLTAGQVETLRKWIAEGAEYQRHWSFEPLQLPAIPQQSSEADPIDAFVAERLHQQGLTFAPAASRETLLRRVSFDLTGLPPTLEDLDRQDESYEDFVDRLLESPHFGERMAVDWLDAARYADTNGYFSDKPRQIWLWRDWVIDAFNRNQPFDEFTIEQLAGDLLPNATTSQRIATGFNRNHVANNETGIIDEEFRTEYVVDRVDTTMTTWLGLTVACAQCHDHKYDPISQREFYQLFSFFNNVPETGLITNDDPPPVMTVSTPEMDRQLADLSAAAAAAMTAFDQRREDLNSRLSAWEATALTSLPVVPTDGTLFHEAFEVAPLKSPSTVAGTGLKFRSGIRAQAATFDATQHVEVSLPEFSTDAPWTIGLWVLPDGSLSCPVSKIEPEGDRRGVELLWQKGRVFVNLVERWGLSALEVATQQPVRSGQWHHVVVTCDGSRSAAGLRVYIDGHPAPVDVRRDSLTGTTNNAEPLRIGRRDSGLGYYGTIDEVRILQRSLSEQTVSDWFDADRIRGIIETRSSVRSGSDTEVLQDYFIDQHGDPSLQTARELVQTTQQAEREFRASIPTTLVMEELPEPRKTHVLLRGQYDQPGDLVQPGVPAVIGKWPEAAARNRLGLARWIVSREHPLTARVAVNRLWAQCFGDGLVRTMNDFGTQGEPPTHPELLDWLAVTFRDSGWDVKALLKRIVTSRTYRQDSAFTVDSQGVVDPQNRWLGRGAAYRMSAEMIRDQALAVSGLLQTKVGGPSAKPYQPPGLWEEVSYNAEDTYVPDQGEGRWRRSLYTYLKRQAPPPAFLAFDGVTREKCAVRRTRTNTPLQSLVLLNDRTYLEAAQALAAVVLSESPADATRLMQLFRRVLLRPPPDAEAQQLMTLLHRQRQRFSAAPDAAKDLMAEAGVVSDGKHPTEELAAWTVVAHTILNLDETVTRR